MLVNVASFFVAATFVAGAPPVLSSVNCVGDGCTTALACAQATFDPIACGQALTADDTLGATYDYEMDTAPTCAGPGLTKKTRAYALELPAGATTVKATKVIAKSADPLQSTLFIDAAVDCGVDALIPVTLVADGTATFDALDLDVKAVPGLVMTGQDQLQVVTMTVTYNAGFPTGTAEVTTTTSSEAVTTTTSSEAVSPPTEEVSPVTITAVACAAECPVECTTAPIDLDTCLAHIPAEEHVTVTYVLETSEPSCATAPHVGVVIPVTGDIYSAEFNAAAAIPDTATTSAGVSADYACAAAAAGSTPTVVFADKTVTFTFTEALPVTENQLLALTVDATGAPATFASAKVTIQGQSQGTMGAAAATSLLALGTFSTAAYLATMF